MGNRTSRHLRPGQHNLRGKISTLICICCDKMVNRKQISIDEIHRKEIQNAVKHSSEDLGDEKQ